MEQDRYFPRQISDRPQEANVALAVEPVDTLLASMSGRTLTQGWDVVTAMSAPKLNDLLVQQYVANLVTGDALPPINGTVSIVGDISAQFVDVVLGPPLISFNPQLAPRQAFLKIGFISGLVMLTKVDGEATTVLSAQTITPQANFQLSGVVPLASVEGEVNQNHVVIDIKNGGTFSAHLGFETGAATILGQFFLDLIIKSGSKFHYLVGTIITGQNTQLSPVLFDFDTQIDGTDSNDTGRVLLFIATTFNPNRGAQTSLDIANIVPQGFSTTVLVSGRVVFQNVLQPAFANRFQPSGITVNSSQTVNGSQPNPDNSFELTFQGTLDAGQVGGRDGSLIVFTSAVPDTEAGFGSKPGDIQVPLTTMTVSPQNNQITFSWNETWGQLFLVEVEGRGGGNFSGNVTMTTDSASSTTATVDPATDVVTFNGSIGVAIGFQSANSVASILNAIAQETGNMGRAAANTINGALSGLLQFQLPGIDTFAVSQLLFPQEHILSLQNAFVPGDLAIFGDLQTTGIEVSPIAPTVTESQQLTFTSNSQSVRWSVNGQGTINPQGVYTAPAMITNISTDVVTATDTSDATRSASAAVTLMVNGLTVAPFFVLAIAGGAGQQFTAAVAGQSQAVTWSLTPNDGSGGTLTASGSYTPPASVTGPVAAKATATSSATPSVAGNALIIITPAGSGTLPVTPAITTTPLTPGGTQQFSAPGDVIWSILPNLGSISPAALYTAPANIEAPATVVAIAISKTASNQIGTGVVLLGPSLQKDR